MNIQPLRDRVLIEPIKEERLLASGLMLPEGAEGRAYRGTVVAAGPGTPQHPVEVKIGDRVVFSRYSGAPLRIDGKELFLITIGDVLAIEE